MPMPSSQLKRAERSIQTIRLSALEGKGDARHADEMTLPNRK
jgi:hypothetical protein